MVTDRAREAVMDALASFVQAKRDIELTFAAGSTEEIVSAVLKGRKAREGRTLGRLDYFVHGVGYTVVVPSGGQVHFDAGELGQGDVFSAYDIKVFLETSGNASQPDVESIKQVLMDLHSAEMLVRFGSRFGIRNV